MPSLSRTENRKHLTFNIRSIVKDQLLIVQGKSFGFTLIELLVVIALFGITSTLITASYITFEKNQRIRNAAQTLKNDLRFAQNKALAGDKGANNECPMANTLVGWYVTINTSPLSYTYAGVCDIGGGQTFNPKTINYPSGVTLNTIKLGGIPQSTTVTILFKPLTTGAVLYSNSGPPFSNSINFSGDLVIELKGSQTSNVNTVTVRPTGEISGN